MPASLKQINARIAREISPKLELVRGDGYHYILLDDSQIGESIMVCYTSQQEPARWVADVRAVYDAVQTPVAKPARAQTIDRHWNDDGSLTIYVGGKKLRRFGGENNEEASEAEMDDVEAFVETWLNRRFPKKAGGWKYGRTTQGHNWHTKRAKALRARITELEAAGTDATEARAELAKISPKA